MDIIKKLPPDIANLIAAGEVATRPASVIKELIENAIDAGADAITAEIKNGGITYMRVTDNGKGIGAQFAEIAFLRHATSKIKDKEDLDRIMTLGFRGEALAAIAAVSKIELFTKTREEEMGVSLRLDAGEVMEKDAAGCPDGTTIIVRDLFYNIPARMKFMKKDATEGANAAAAVFHAALSHPEISIKFIKDGRTELHSPGGGSLYDCVYGVLGRDFARSLIEAKYSMDGVSIEGYITKPSAAHARQNRQHFFINGRYIKSRVMGIALEEGYKNSIMTGRYPGCVLHLTLDPALFDVNVHPAKTEVKFINERSVFDCVLFSVRSALRADSGRVEVKFKEPGPESGKTPVLNPAASASGFDTPPDTAVPETADLQKTALTAARPEKAELSPDTDDTAFSELKGGAYVRDSFRLTYSKSPLFYPSINIEYSDPDEKEDSAEPIPAAREASAPHADILPKDMARDVRIIGEALSTYILAEDGDELLLIDKHAAHERIIFERLKNGENGLMSQLLITPQILTLAPKEKTALIENAEILADLGFELDEFGGGSIIVRRLPADLDISDIESALEDVAAAILEERTPSPSVRDGILRELACKAAIKAGKRSAPDELSSLVNEVLKRDDTKYCPHGRPICVSMSRASIEKQFGRT